VRTISARLVNDASSGVPFWTERWFIWYMPVSSEVRLGPHGGHWPKCCVKRTPSSASRSIAGVRTVGWWAAERQSARNWSAVISSTFIPAWPIR
jgi:hypothetical protein